LSQLELLAQYTIQIEATPKVHKTPCIKYRT